MDKQYLINQLKAFADSYHISIDEDTLGDIISKSSFRVVSKGEILSSIGDDTTIAGMVLSGLTRCYYIDHDGNDITRGFAAAGYLCMDEGFFGYTERLCMWEALEETMVIHKPNNLLDNLKEAVPLIKDGRIRSIGTSNVSLEHIKQAEQLLAKDKYCRSVNRSSISRNEATIFTLWS